MIKTKNALKSLLLLLTFVLSIVAGASQTLAATGIINARENGGNAWAKGQYSTVRLVSINDFHGNVEKTSSNPGIARIAGVLDEMRKKMPTWFFSAGDNFQGTAISNLTHGEVLNEAFKIMKLQASAIGNHEYDWGKDMMYDWSDEGGYPFLASNIVYTDTKEPVDYAEPYMIKEFQLKGGKIVKVGFIGIATPETETKTAAANVADIDFTDPVVATNHWVEILQQDEKVDAIVALTHLGGYQSTEGVITGEVAEYAKKITGVDLIFSGHTHQTIDGEVNGIPILQGRYNGRSLQVAELTFNNYSGDLYKSDGFIDPISTRIDLLPVNEEVAALVAEYKAELADILNEHVGTNAQLLDHTTAGLANGLTPLGQWTAQTLAGIGETEIGIVNGGGIREPMPAGEITMGTMYALFPFDNTLVTLKVTGTKLIQLIEHGIEPPTFGDGQFYGVKVQVDLKKPYGSRITQITLQNGDPVLPDQLYSVSTLDFLLTGGDKYDFSGATAVVDTFIPVRQVLADYIKSIGTLVHVYDTSAYIIN